MEGGDAGVADAGVGGGDVFDEVFGADEPADAPACCVEVFACGADGEGQGSDFGGESGDAGEGDVVKAVVDFVGEDENVVLDAEAADGFEFGFGEDFADGVVGGVEDNHAGFGVDGVFKGFEVESPVCGGSLLCGTI